jgi:hypothetical protein
MNNIEILANILSKSVILKDYMLLWDGNEVNAYKDEDDGEWYLEIEVGNLALDVPLSDFDDISWGKNSIKIIWGGKSYKLQLVQVLDPKQFRFAK